MSACGVEVAAASKLIIVVSPGALRPSALPWFALVCELPRVSLSISMRVPELQDVAQKL